MGRVTVMLTTLALLMGLTAGIALAASAEEVDVELVLVLPLLVRFTRFIQMGEGSMIFAKVFLFVGTLLLGLVYAGVRGDLSWNKSVVASKESSCE